MWTFVETVRIESNFGRWSALVTLEKGGVPESCYLNFRDVEPTSTQADAAGAAYALRRTLDESPDMAIAAADAAANEFMPREIFFAKFTNTEIAAIYRAMNSNDNLFAYVKKMEITPMIRRAHPDTVNGLNMLEAVGLIGPGRAAQILQR